MSGIFSQPRMRDYDLKDLYDGTPFRILAVSTRETTTDYGPATVCDLFVESSDQFPVPVGSENPDVLFSGFSAGIARQIDASNRRDFPTWARIERKLLAHGKSTTILVPAHGPDDRGSAVPTDEDIPF